MSDVSKTSEELAAVPIFEAMAGLAFSEEFLGSREWSRALEVAEASLAATRVPVQGEPNACLDHKPVQHRDGKPPWCNACGRATIPDAATEVHDPKNMSIMNGWLVECIGEHTCGTEPDGYYGAHEPGCGYEPLVNLSELPGYPDEEKWGVALGDMTERAQKAEAERDAALAAIERVRAIHPPVECDRHEGCPPSCEICLDDWPCPTIQALDGAPEPGLSESERLELEGTPYVWSPDSLAYQLDGWVNDLGLPGNSLLEEIGVQEGVYYADQSVLSEKLQEVTIAWLETHGYRRDGAPEPEWEYALQDEGDDEPWSEWYESRERLAERLGVLAERDDERLVRRRKAGPWLPVEGSES